MTQKSRAKVNAAAQKHEPTMKSPEQEPSRSEDSLFLRASPQSDQKDVRRPITEKSENFFELSNFPASNRDLEAEFNVVKTNQIKDKIQLPRRIPNLIRTLPAEKEMN